MKSIIITVLFFIGAFATLAQNYKPILDYRNEWHFTTCDFGCYTDKYYTDGDTLVGGKIYKILEGYHFISRTFLLREEVSEKKLYFLKIRPGGGTEEFLLYDFTLEVGDTINMLNPITPFPQDGGYFRLDSIVPRPLVDGINYDHFYFSPTPTNSNSTENAIWVEGVGSLSLINAPGGHPDLNGVGALSCYFKNTEVFYSNLDSIDDCVPVYMNLPERMLREVIISKSNSSDICWLNNAMHVKEANVYDLSGKKLMTIQNSFNQKMTIDLSRFNSGMYIIIARGMGDIKQTFKIVK
ncbi:MAG TPA: hypothetical protein DDZ79_00150 [Aequorivita sp.]|nr:hypothetical protein [Aequorivita sp.]